jgi:hypothetical protein
MNKLLNEIRELNIDFPRPWNTAGARGIAPLGRRFPADCRRPMRPRGPSTGRRGRALLCTVPDRPRICFPGGAKGMGAPAAAQASALRDLFAASYRESRRPQDISLRAFVNIRC